MCVRMCGRVWMCIGGWGLRGDVGGCGMDMWGKVCVRVAVGRVCVRVCVGRWERPPAPLHGASPQWHTSSRSYT